MKRIFAITVAIVLCLSSLFCISASAEGEQTVNVSVSITTKDKLHVALWDIALGDEDGDGAITVNDALYAAHELAYIGGAKYGYASAESEWGVSLTKLWGDESGNFGYYINHKPANSLADTVKEGDVINACIYTGVYPNLESYTYFDVNRVKVDQGESVTLTLVKLTYDENFNVVSSPVPNAKITTDTSPFDEYVTDENGKVTFKPLWLADMVVSAICEDESIIMPVCRVWVNEVPQNSDMNSPDIENNVATDANGSEIAGTNNATGENSANGGSASSQNGGCGGCGSTFGGFAIIALSLVGASVCVIKRTNKRD